MDTSEHAWLEGRAEAEPVLVKMIDDATSRVRLRFSPSDTTEANLVMPGRWVRRHGRPQAVASRRRLRGERPDEPPWKRLDRVIEDWIRKSDEEREALARRFDGPGTGPSNKDEGVRESGPSGKDRSSSDATDPEGVRSRSDPFQPFVERVPSGQGSKKDGERVVRIDLGRIGRQA